MGRIFTEESAQQRQRNIADLNAALEQKHNEIQVVGDDIDGKVLLREVHAMAKDTRIELKEMRVKLEEERVINEQLRQRVRRKNRQLVDMQRKDVKNGKDGKEESVEAR